MDTIFAPDLGQKTGPKYLALSEAIHAAVGDGRLAPGAQLPPVRELAWSLSVTPGTVARAYQRLTEAGVLAAQVGRGTFVADRRAPRGRSAGPVDMRRSTVPDVGQGPAIRRALILAADAAEELLLYPSRESGGPLRAALCDYLAPFDLGAFGPEDIALGHGAQHAYLLVLQAVLSGAAPAVAMQTLSFPGFRHGARLVRAECAYVRSDAEGPLPDSLAEACDRADVQVFVTSAFAHNPTTIRTSLDRRREIVALARERNFQIVEDETYGQPDPGMPNYRALAPERTWLVGSFSKNLSPALRLGYLVAAEGRADEAVRAGQQATFGLAMPIKTATAELLRNGTAAQVRTASRRVADDWSAMLAEVFAGHDIRTRPGVPFAWLRLPPGWRPSALVRAAEAAGILVRPAEDYVARDAQVPSAIRLSLNASVPPATARDAAERLRALFDAPPSEIAA